MLKRVLHILILFLCICANAQVHYDGFILDVGSQSAIENVQIINEEQFINTHTDPLGAYQICYRMYCNDNEKQFSFWFQDNGLFWVSKDQLILSLYNMQGNLLYTVNSNDNTGNINFNNLKYGWYILRLQSSKQAIKLKIFFNGFDFFVEDKISSSENVDLLIELSKENYYSRIINFQPTTSTIESYLLAYAYDSLKYFPEMIRYEALNMVYSDPHTTNFGNVKSVKIIYDFINDKIYYINTARYTSHFEFVNNVLGTERSAWAFFKTHYGINTDRQYHAVTLDYHKSIGKYVFQFSPYDLADCNQIKDTYQKILESAYFSDSLYFFVNNTKWENCTDVPTISANELFNGQNYQALNLGEGYGYLTKVDIANYEANSLGIHDIVLLNGIPNDISVVSGIITTEYQTPLSHINILSLNRNTPNMALINGWDDPGIDSLLGKLVHLLVMSNSYTISLANVDSAKVFWDERESREPTKLEMDTITKGLVNFDEAGYEWVKTIGGKASNFAEMVNLGNIALPESSFAIPFYYYQQHIRDNGIEVFIQNMLNDPLFYSDVNYRSGRLLHLQNLIVAAPLNKELEQLVLRKIEYFKDFDSFRFRSSTNAEDLEEFSGAGLYSSESARKNSSSKTVEKAIKKVWSSLWNIRAFNEREYYKIDQQSIAMGVLVHRSFPDENANGVLVTKNLYNVNSGFTINVQYKEYEITEPDENITHDLILAFNISLNGDQYTYEYLSRSNIIELGGATVLSDDELDALCTICEKLKYHYYYNVPHNSKLDYRDFALDIEFKIDSEIQDRKIYIKQVRFYPHND